MRTLRHAAPILLITCFLALGSGTLRFAHDAQHAREDAAAAPCSDTAAGGGHHSHGPHRHDHHPHNESNCATHALLSAPLLAATAVPVLVERGLFVAFLTLLSPPVAQIRLPARIDCRGPPLCRA
jgi:hypothetical protein